MAPQILGFYSMGRIGVFVRFDELEVFVWCDELSPFNLFNCELNSFCQPVF